MDSLHESIAYDPKTGAMTRLRSASHAKAGDDATHQHIKGYRCVHVGGRSYLAHRLAWFLAHGSWPVGQIDHRNGDRTDNRLDNLRDVSQSVNQQNMRKAKAHNPSALLGVSANYEKWVARIRVDGRQIHLGRFDTPEEAHAAYLKAKRAAHSGCTI